MFDDDPPSDPSDAVPVAAGLPGPVGLPDEAAGLVARFDALVDEWLALDLDAMSSAPVLELTRRFEVTRRRLRAVEHRLVAELTDRGVAGELFAPNTAALLRLTLRISPGEAARRVRAATELGPRRTLTGQVLPPRFPDLAAAQASGRSRPNTPTSSPARSTNCPPPCTTSSASSSRPNYSPAPTSSTPEH